MIGQVIRNGLTRMRSEAESLMVDAVEIRRGGELTTDPATGVVSAVSTLIYSGPARVHPETAMSGTEQNAGEARDILSAVKVDAPLSVLAHTNDTVLVTASDDPALVGVRLRAVSVAYGGQISSRHIHCRFEG